jgi:hypothetical protein
MRYLWIVAIALTLGLSFAVAAEEKAELHKLGRTKIGEYTVSTNMRGDPHMVKTVEFDVKLFDKEASKTPPPDPKAMRIWIGAEDAKADQKVAMTKKTSTFGATVTVPQPLDEKTAKVWVEIDTAAGTSRGSFSMEHDHKH